MELRPYQTKAIQAIEEDFRGHCRLILVMATGCGKTVVFSHIAKDVVSQGQRVLILAHREELLYQAQDKLLTACGVESSLEKAQLEAEKESPVVIASIQTLSQDNRLKKYPRGSFGLIIVDEAHHSVSKTYTKVLDYFGKTKVLGVTATPNRADHCSLSQYYEKISFEYNLPQAIKEHYLCNISVKNIPLTLDISNVKVTAGDFQAKDLGNALEPYLTQIADIMARECKGRHTVVFLPLVRLSQMFAEMLNERGLRAAEINAASTDRAEVLQDFHNGNIDVICNAMLLTEGFDEPSIDCIVVLRPTKSDSLFAQMIGRGTRLSEGKDHLLLLDFLWQTAKHDICHPSDLIAPNLDVSLRMRRIIRKKKKEVDLEAALAQALQEQLDENRAEKAKNFFLVNLAESLGDLELGIFTPTFQWEKDKVTEKQKQALTSFGVDADKVVTKGLASAILHRMFDRREANLSTLKQIRCLEKKGFQKVCDWTFQQASNLLSIISKNNWRVPDGIDPKSYLPPKENEKPQMNKPRGKDSKGNPPKKSIASACDPFANCSTCSIFLVSEDVPTDRQFIHKLAEKFPGNIPVVFAPKRRGGLFCLPRKFWLAEDHAVREILSSHYQRNLHFYPSRSLKSYILRAK